MPKYRPETQLSKIKKLTRDYLSTPDLCKADVARKRHTSRQNITKQINRKSVQDFLQKFLDSPKLDKALIEVGIDGLKAEKDISCNVISQDGEGMKDANSMTKDFVKVPDYNARHKYWHDFLVAKGKLKINGNGNGHSIINIVYAYRKSAEEKCLQH